MTKTLILAVNGGSSSVKIAVFDGQAERLAEAEASGIGTPSGGEIRSSGLGDAAPVALAPGTSLKSAIDALAARVVAHAGGTISGIGHRVVHGGMDFSSPVVIDHQTLDAIRALSPLAPLHQPHNVEGIEAFGRAFPQALQVACFDTAFHRTIPMLRQHYALPPEHARAGLVAYGFHGLNCTHVTDRFEALTGTALPARLVIAHLGNGASVTAVRDGRSVFNSMGFTPLDGLMMGQRVGRIDPGAVLALVDRHGGDTAAVTRLLNRGSGLLGVSGISSDMRALMASSSPDAALAIAMFVDRVVRVIGEAAAAAGGIDALVFTGGIGAGSKAIRQSVVDQLGWLGLVLDAEANDAGGPRITTPSSAVSAYSIRADEEAVIARSVLERL